MYIKKRIKNKKYDTKICDLNFHYLVFVKIWKMEFTALNKWFAASQVAPYKS